MLYAYYLDVDLRNILSKYINRIEIVLEPKLYIMFQINIEILLLGSLMEMS